jgi:hypothetical protein
MNIYLKTHDAPSKGKKRPDNIARNKKIFIGKSSWNKDLKGKGNPNYIDERCSKEYYCLICNKAVNYHTALYSSGLCMSCAMKELFKTPENCANWQGGLNKLGYYLFTESLKEEIRERDNHECQLCYKSGKQELKDLNRKLAVHHIDYNRKNYHINNLISLCLSCHLKTNGNRNYWYAYFIYIMENFICS